jgi:hypothetical protein
MSISGNHAPAVDYHIDATMTLDLTDDEKAALVALSSTRSNMTAIRWPAARPAEINPGEAGTLEPPAPQHEPLPPLPVYTGPKVGCGGGDDEILDRPYARPTIYRFRRLLRSTGSMDGAAGKLVSGRARGIRHGARAAGKRANERRCATISTVAERTAPGQPRGAGDRAIE